MIEHTLYSMGFFLSKNSSMYDMYELWPTEIFAQPGEICNS